MKKITHYACDLCGRVISTKWYLKKGWTTTDGEYHLTCRNYKHHPRARAHGGSIDGVFIAVEVDVLSIRKRAIQI